MCTHTHGLHFHTVSSVRAGRSGLVLCTPSNAGRDDLRKSFKLYDASETVDDSNTSRTRCILDRNAADGYEGFGMLNCDEECRHESR
ncbi:hypothetical protein EVAR_855_1 [Eumeta japonica]|uniref:Uncharacterized protein n=1 Tax=Eumeta variegata TaxID=151549 RepID=A0A4C1SDW9_EUMVA|nr:hypothetical protein EVAR_855_1 [Eumeta japonica]